MGGEVRRSNRRTPTNHLQTVYNFDGPLAQRSERAAHNRLVLGSNPRGTTKISMEDEPALGRAPIGNRLGVQRWTLRFEHAFFLHSRASSLTQSPGLQILEASTHEST